MPHTYLKGVGSTRKTPQSQPIPGAEQVKNAGGGFVWTVDTLTRMRRWLILGSEGGTYYVDERTFTFANAGVVREALDEHGVEAVAEIVAISEGGRAPKQEPAIFALAMASGHPNKDVRIAALKAIPRVCRYGTSLFHFVDHAETFRGWGRGMRKGVSAYYTDRPAEQVAYDVVKYRHRDGWAQRDMARLSKPKPPRRSAHDDILAWVTNHPLPTPVTPGLRIIEGFERAQASSSPALTASLVHEYGLPREALLTEHLNDIGVWDALLHAGPYGMPIGALVRNLAKMTRIGLLTPTSEATRFAVSRLADSVALTKGRMHPIALLNASKIYGRGYGERGSERWDPIVQIVDGLDEGFYLSFGAVETTGKRFLLGIDISGSMAGPPIAGIPGLSPREAAAAMAMVTVQTEPMTETVIFTAGKGYEARMNYGTSFRGGGDRWKVPDDYRHPRWRADRRQGHIQVGYADATEDLLGVTPVMLSKRRRVDDVMREIDSVPAGGTDCALPMLYAADRDREVDCFVIYTDNETWAGSIHPAQALAAYREKSGIDAKLIVVAFTATEHTIADPNDAGMLDVVGFDTATPAIMTDFVSGSLGRID